MTAKLSFCGPTGDPRSFLLEEGRDHEPVRGLDQPAGVAVQRQESGAHSSPPLGCP